MKLFVFRCFCVFAFFQARPFVACEKEVSCWDDPIENMHRRPILATLGIMPSGVTSGVTTSLISIDDSTFLGGFSASFEYFKPDAIYGFIGGSLSYGEGMESLVGGKKLSLPVATAELISAELRLGYAMAQKQLIVTPFFGAYTFTFQDHLQETAIGFEAGVKNLYLYSSSFDLGFEFELLSNFFNHITYSSLKGVEANSIGATFSLPLTWHYGYEKYSSIGFKPFANLFSFSPNLYNYGCLFFIGTRG